MPAPLNLFSLHCASGSFHLHSPSPYVTERSRHTGPEHCFLIMSTMRSIYYPSGHVTLSLHTVTVFLYLSLCAPPVSLLGTFPCTLPVLNLLSLLLLNLPFPARQGIRHPNLAGNRQRQSCKAPRTRL